MESVDELDFAELLLDPFDSADAPLRVTLEEEDSSSMLLDDSSSRGAKLLSSSPQAANSNVNASAKTRVMDPRPLAKDDWPRVTGKDDVNNSFFILDKFAMTCFITIPKRLF